VNENILVQSIANSGVHVAHDHLHGRTASTLALHLIAVEGQESIAATGVLDQTNMLPVGVVSDQADIPGQQIGSRDDIDELVLRREWMRRSPLE